MLQNNSNYNNVLRIILPLIIIETAALIVFIIIHELGHIIFSFFTGGYCTAVKLTIIEHPYVSLIGGDEYWIGLGAYISLGVFGIVFLLIAKKLTFLEYRILFLILSFYCVFNAAAPICYSFIFDNISSICSDYWDFDNPSVSLYLIFSLSIVLLIFTLYIYKLLYRTFLQLFSLKSSLARGLYFPFVVMSPIFAPNFLLMFVDIHKITGRLLSFGLLIIFTLILTGISYRANFIINPEPYQKRKKVFRTILIISSLIIVVSFVFSIIHPKPVELQDSKHVYEKLAQNKSGWANYILGLNYEFGADTDIDLDKALSFYQASLKCKYPIAAVTLAKIKNDPQLYKLSSIYAEEYLSGLRDTTNNLFAQQYTRIMVGDYKNAQHYLIRIINSSYYGSEIKNDASRRIYCALWYVVYGIILKQDYSHELKMLKDISHKGDDWEKNLSLFMEQNFSENNLLALATSAKDNEKDGRLCEAYFYIGILALQRNDIVKANEMFQKCVNTKITSYLEWDFAYSLLCNLTFSKGK